MGVGFPPRPLRVVCLQILGVVLHDERSTRGSTLQPCPHAGATDPQRVEPAGGLVFAWRSSGAHRSVRPLLNR
jgi:hypothetical protein